MFRVEFSVDGKLSSVNQLASRKVEGKKSKFSTRPGRLTCRRKETLDLGLLAYMGTCSGWCLTFYSISESLDLISILVKFEKEKSKLISTMFVGVSVGNIVASAVGGRLCAAFGWRSAFWSAGVCNIIFVVLWYRLRHSRLLYHSTWFHAVFLNAIKPSYRYARGA